MSDNIPSKPEMKAGKPDLFSIDTMTAIRMGTRNLKKYMYEIQEEGKKLGLVVKVERSTVGLLLWWYPEEMAAELGGPIADIVKETDEFDRNEFAYLREVMPGEGLVERQDTPELFYTEVEGTYALDQSRPGKEYRYNWTSIKNWIEGMVSGQGNFCAIRRSRLIPMDDGISQLQEVFFTVLDEKGLDGHLEEGKDHRLTFYWEPRKKTPTFFDDVLQHMSTVPEGQMEAEKKLLLESVDVETMDELLGFFKTAGEVLKLDITMMYSSSGENVTLYWGPRETLDDDQTAPPT